MMICKFHSLNEAILWTEPVISLDRHLWGCHPKILTTPFQVLLYTPQTEIHGGNPGQNLQFKLDSVQLFNLFPASIVFSNESNKISGSKRIVTGQVTSTPFTDPVEPSQLRVVLGQYVENEFFSHFQVQECIILHSVCCYINLLTRINVSPLLPN